MNPGLGADYELLAAVANFVQVLAWIAILVGAFLRESGTREYLCMGAEGLGWVALIGSGIVGSQIAAQQALNCTLWGRDCIETDAQAWAYLWEHLLKGIVYDAVVGGVAELVGWSAARLRKSRQTSGPDA